MKNKIESLLNEIKEFSIASSDELENFRLKYLSKKGSVNDLFADFKLVASEEKKEVGQLINKLKQAAQNKFNNIKESIAIQSLIDVSSEDFTKSPEPQNTGSRHPISAVRGEIVDIFSRLGFTVAEGPEIEDDWHVFSGLNFPEEHPARDMQDTFFIEKNPDVLLRTHTSSVQVRIMENNQPPLRQIFPGRVFLLV